MQKIKSIKFSGLLTIIKCCLIGVISTLIGIVIFAVILKFADLSTIVISAVNNVIKIFSIFIMMTCIKRAMGDKLFIKSILAGVIYATLTFMIFSILNGGFVFDFSFVYDLLFSVIVSAIVSIIINILNRNRT